MKCRASADERGSEVHTVVVEPPQPAGDHRWRTVRLTQSFREAASASGTTTLLERGAKLGLFRAGVDPVQLYISIAGMSYFYLGNNHTLSTIFDRELLSTKAQVERLSHTTDLILGFLVRD